MNTYWTDSTNLSKYYLYFLSIRYIYIISSINFYWYIWIFEYSFIYNLLLWYSWNIQLTKIIFISWKNFLSYDLDAYYQSTTLRIFHLLSFALESCQGVLSQYYLDSIQQSLYYWLFWSIFQFKYISLILYKYIYIMFNAHRTH